MNKSSRLLSIVLAIFMFASLSIISPSSASDEIGNASTYLTDPIYQELATDLSNTQAMLSDSERTIGVSLGSLFNPDGPAADSTRFTTTVKISSRSFSEANLNQSWDPGTNDWAQGTEYAHGYDDQSDQSYASLSNFNIGNDEATLARLKKPSATWAVEPRLSTDYNFATVPDRGITYDPSTNRISMVAGLTSTAQVTENTTATISEISVRRDFPTGYDTFTLRSDTAYWSHDYAFVVTPVTPGSGSGIVWTLWDTKYRLNLDRSRSERLYTASANLLDMSYAEPVVSLMPVNAVTVNMSAFRNMGMRINAEKSVQKSANSVASKARLLSKKAKGKGKGKVTTLIIRAAAKSLSVKSKKIKNGLKITGTDPFGYAKGYICVIAYKQKAVVKHC